ncbi:MAG: TadE/TadG family type IV pilus assembly protein [Candidatus Acidiferrales bacterium]
MAFGYLLRRQDGSTLIEFALTLTMFLLMLFGIVDFGRALYAYHFVSNAAREATRWAAVNGSNCGDSCDAPATPAAVQNFVAQITPAGIDSTKITTSAHWIAEPNSPPICQSDAESPGCTVEVEVSYAFNFLAPIVHQGAITLSSTSEMVIAH